jgi:hypothetical protein
VRGWQLSLGHLADSLSKLDGAGRVLDPVTTASDDLLVDDAVEPGVVGEVADDVSVYRDVPGRAGEGARWQVGFPSRQGPADGDRAELERALGSVSGGVGVRPDDFGCCSDRPDETLKQVNADVEDDGPLRAGSPFQEIPNHCPRRVTYRTVTLTGRLGSFHSMSFLNRAAVAA